MFCEITFDSNKRTDPVLNNTGLFSDETIKRVVSLALPFLSLNSVTGSITSVVMGTYQSWCLLNDLQTCYQTGEWDSFNQKAVFFAIVVSSTALSIIFPLGQMLISNGVQSITTMYSLVVHFKTQEWKEAGKDALRLFHVGIYLASVCIGGPELLIASLLAQAGIEIMQAYREYTKGGWDRVPEVLAALFMATIRVHAAVPHIKTVKRNYWGVQLSKQKWEMLYEEINQRKGKRQENIDIEALLIEENISSYIEEIDFTETTLLTDLCFKNMKFKNCNFKGVNFSDSIFHNISADSCLFNHSLWIHSIVRNSHFNGCDFTFAAMIRGVVDRVSFVDSHLQLMCFNDSLLNRPLFKACNMLETSFLGAGVRQGSLVESDLTDCLLLDTKENFQITRCTPHQITKPIIGLGWNFKESGIFTPLNFGALRDSQSIPLRYEQIPADVDGSVLEKEVRTQIAQIQAKKPEEMLSIPDEILKQAQRDSTIAQIQAKAASYLKHMDGLSIPGGPDVHPEFYGAIKDPKTFPDEDYRRSLLEFALISLAHKHKVPMMGTCRGSQMINVFFGGTLKQHVEDQHGFQQLQIVESSRKEWVRQLVGDNFFGFSAHHQASDKIGKDLEVVLQADKITKLFLSRDGLIIGSQIHPEVYWALKEYTPEKEFIANPVLKEIMEKNQNIYRYFINQADAFRSFHSTR